MAVESCESVRVVCPLMTLPSSRHSTMIGGAVLAFDGPSTVKVSVCSGKFTVTVEAGVELVIGLTRL